LTVPSSSVAVKICGLTREEDAAWAEGQGAAFLGGIFAGGPRLLDVPRARAVLGPRRRGVERVGVFGVQTERQLLVLADDVDVDVIQLHGDHSPESAARIARESERAVWPVLRVTGQSLPDGADELAAVSGSIVLDAHVVGQLGGTGVPLDWSGLVDAVAALRVAVPELRLVLAGGLRPENVAQAIRLLSPQVVDVSSGVESAPGVKDPALVQQFVMAAHGAAEMQR
jgi:phosphoribosylanthranilate isomerase